MVGCRCRLLRWGLGAAETTEALRLRVLVLLLRASAACLLLAACCYKRGKACACARRQLAGARDRLHGITSALRWVVALRWLLLLLVRQAAKGGIAS